MTATLVASSRVWSGWCVEKTTPRPRSRKACKGWLAGSCGPSSLHFEGLVRSSEAIYQRLMIRTGRGPVVSRKSLEVLRRETLRLAGAIEAAMTE